MSVLFLRYHLGFLFFLFSSRESTINGRSLYGGEKMNSSQRKTDIFHHVRQIGVIIDSWSVGIGAETIFARESYILVCFSDLSDLRALQNWKHHLLDI